MFPDSPLVNILPHLLYCFICLPVYLSDLFLSEPFERNLQIPCPFIPNYFKVYFLRLGVFSYLTIVQLSGLLNLILIPYFHLNYCTACFPFLSVDPGISFTAFFPLSGTGSRLGLGITFSCVSLASCDQKHFQSLYFFVYNIEVFKEYSTPIPL